MRSSRISSRRASAFLSLRKTRDCLFASAVCNHKKCLQAPPPPHRLAQLRCDPLGGSRVPAWRVWAELRAQGETLNDKLLGDVAPTATSRRDRTAGKRRGFGCTRKVHVCH